MRKCNVCGRRFRLLAKNRYEVVKRPVGLNCLMEGTVYYNAFDCPHCGCQNIVGICEKETVRNIEEQSQESEEQESVLDKIKEEIRDNTYYINELTEKEGIDFETVEKIIDKYKAESEEEKMIKDLTGIAKPCPMCGSKRIYMPYPKIDFIYSVHIQCADCGLNGYKNVFKDVDIDDAMERTIKYWNTRAESEDEEVIANDE